MAGENKQKITKTNVVLHFSYIFPALSPQTVFSDVKCPNPIAPPLVHAVQIFLDDCLPEVICTSPRENRRTR